VNYKINDNAVRRVILQKTLKYNRHVRHKDNILLTATTKP